MDNIEKTITTLEQYCNSLRFAKEALSACDDLRNLKNAGKEARAVLDAANKELITSQKKLTEIDNDIAGSFKKAEEIISDAQAKAASEIDNAQAKASKLVADAKESADKAALEITAKARAEAASVTLAVEGLKEEKRQFEVLKAENDRVRAEIETERARLDKIKAELAAIMNIKG